MRAAANSLGIAPTPTTPNRVSVLIEKWPVASYFVLTIVISWVAGLAVVGPGGLPLTQERFERLGPMLYVAVLLGPSGASIVLTRLLDGSAGVRALFGRLRRWRIGARHYGLALLPAAVVATVLLTMSAFIPSFVPALFTADDKATALLLIVVLSFVFGFFEELGWSGFAVPRLLANHGVFATGIVVGVAWGLWHFPLFWEVDSFAAPLPFAILLARLFSWLPGFRILMVWLYERSGSLLVPVLTHASLVATTLIFIPNAVTGPTLLLQILVWPATIWLMVAMLAVANRRRQAAPTQPHRS